MKRFQIAFLLAGSCLLTLTAYACGGGGGTVPATSESPSPVPGISITLPRAATPAEAGATLPAPSLPTASNLPQDLAKGVSNTKGALSVRFELSSTVTFVLNGKETTQQGVNVKGEGNGPDQNVTFSSPNLATGNVETYEMIKIGDQSYAKGLTFGPNLDPNTWYQMPAQTTNPQGSAGNPQGILSGMKESDFLSGDFKLTGNGTIDGQSCQVWATQNPGLAAEFGSLTNNPDVVRQLSAVDTAQFNLWTCPDGYLHQVQGAITGHDSKSPGDKARVDFRYHYYDFGAKIAISAPANPQPIPVIGPVMTPTP